MFNKPLCIYSNYCKYSKNFISTLATIPELFSGFDYICIDVDLKTFSNIYNISIVTIVKTYNKLLLYKNNIDKWLK